MISAGRVIKPILIVGLLFIIVSAFSQRIKPNRWYVAADGGISVFFGDVKRYDYIPDFESPSEIQPMFSASFGKEFSKVFGLRAQFLYGKTSGHKQSSHYNFESFTLGAHAMADINLVYLFTNTRFGKSRLNVLSSLGVGYMDWNSTLYYDVPLKDGTTIMDESKEGSLSFPGSLSVEYLLSKNFSLNLQGMLYVITSDKVDAKEGGIKTDMINYNSLGVVYKFTSKRKAKRRSVKFALDPMLYEPNETDKEKEKLAVVEKEEAPDEIKEELVVEEPVVEEIVDEPKKQYVVHEVHKPENQIDHELEKEAIHKEVWTPKNEDAWPDIVFSVQILAAKIQHTPAELQMQYDIKEQIFEKFDGDLYRYNVGSYDKLWRAKETRNIIRSESGIEGAFIVVYRNDEKISLEEAMNYAARKQTLIANVEETPVSEEAAERVYPLVQLKDNIPQEGYLIGVQILSMKSDAYPMGVFKGIYGIDNPVLVHFKDPWYKMVVSGFDSVHEAYDFQKTVRGKGFIDAFVLVFKDGKRISMRRFNEESSK